MCIYIYIYIYIYIEFHCELDQLFVFVFKFKKLNFISSYIEATTCFSSICVFMLCKAIKISFYLFRNLSFFFALSLYHFQYIHIQDHSTRDYCNLQATNILKLRMHSLIECKFTVNTQ